MDKSVTVGGVKFIASDKIVEGESAPIQYMPDIFDRVNEDQLKHKVIIEPNVDDKNSLITFLRAELDEKEKIIADLEESLRTVKNTLTLKTSVATMRAKRIDNLTEHVEKLKQLVLLTDPAVHNVEMNDLTMRQWTEYRKWCIETEGVSHAIS